MVFDLSKNGTAGLNPTCSMNTCMSTFIYLVLSQSGGNEFEFGHLTMLIQLQRLHGTQWDGKMVNGEWLYIWKEVAIFHKILFCFMPGDTEDVIRNLSTLRKHPWIERGTSEIQVYSVNHNTHPIAVASSCPRPLVFN
jgi:hypothetical protein